MFSLEYECNCALFLQNTEMLLLLFDIKLSFVSKWETAVRECEHKLATTIIDHLKNTADKTNMAIRAMSKETFKNLKTINPSGATRSRPSLRLKKQEPKRETRKRKRTENNNAANKKSERKLKTLITN